MRICWTVAAMLAVCAGACAQMPVDSDAPSLLSDVPSVPGIGAKLRGLNAGVTLAGVHDSSSGWYTVMTPAATFAFAKHYSVDVSMPVYVYRLAEESTTTTVQPPPPAPGAPLPPLRTVTTSVLKPQHWEPGDVVLAGHGNWERRWLAYTLTPSLTLPSGDSDHGLSTGRVTFDFDNHFEARTRAVDLVLGMGGGDSSNLFNRLVTKDYTSLGPLAHFQAGVRVPLPLGWSFESVAYEQLPIGDNKIYETVQRPGRPARQIVTGRSVSEDNGFTNSLTVPLVKHVSLLGYYNRSLRFHLDDVAVGITFVVRTPRVGRRPVSLLDELK